MAEAESRLLEELEQFGGDDASRPKTHQVWAALSSLEQAAVQWHAEEGDGEEEEEEEEEEGSSGRSSLSVP